MDKKIARVFDCQDNYSEIGFTSRTSDKYIENWCMQRGLEIFNITIEWQHKNYPNPKRRKASADKVGTMVKAKLPTFRVKIGFMDDELNEPIWIIERVVTFNQIEGTLPQVVFDCLDKRGYVLYKDDDNVHYDISEI